MAQANIPLMDFEAATREPETRADPYPFYSKLRDVARVHRTTIGSLVVHRHADVTTALRDNRLSSSNDHDEGFAQFKEMAKQMGFAPLIEVSESVMLFLDPPDHTRLRRLAGKAFTVRTVEAMRGRIQSLIDSMLDDAEKRGSFDLIADVAYPLPVTVISEMMGVPLSDKEQLQEWTAIAVRALDPSDDLQQMMTAGVGVGHLREYFDKLVEVRRQDMGDDLLSALIAAEDEGDRLSHIELLATCILLYAAGFETTVNLIGNGMLALLDNRAQYERLGADQTLAASATEEVLRFDSPVQFTGRTAVEDLEVAGEPVAKGKQVLVLLAAANRDPEEFAEPDRMDITRSPNRHVAFSGGIHTCLGAALARVEGQVALATMARHFPQLQLDGEPRRRETVTLRGLEALPVRVS